MPLTNYIGDTIHYCCIMDVNFHRIRNWFNPCPFRAVANGVFQGGVRTGTLDKAADAVWQVGGVLILGSAHHAGHLAIAGGSGRLCGGHIHALRLGQCFIHLAGQLCAAFTVLGHQPVGVGHKAVRVGGAVGVYVFPHELPGFLVQPGQPGDVLIPRFR